jgi:autotransporter adhesin
LSALHDNSVEMANAYTDRRIEDLDKNLSAGVAGAVALSSVAVSGVERGEVSVGAGYGYFNGQSAAAFGATMGLSNRWSINAGAGISNADVSFRAGTNYKFKLF